ncbi:hypothetical protein FNV43_RR25867 [Rhamnella rubrinervis]|uniref:Uncharacterized protein n=1 Tax=Rhamnella rubrinervis TaxID=2594499 RepID=A0A8K0DTY1_9ROSA|nr:hypothetical protein FNV43_RR25867 [Rhamnella rubrinervis]
MLVSVGCCSSTVLLKMLVKPFGCQMSRHRTYAGALEFVQFLNPNATCALNLIAADPKPMAEKQSLASTSSEAYHTVFIDTSLDTHLAIIVSDLDTVSDLKRKIEKEYPLCFPNVGKITIGAVKVKRRGHLYHLSDSMYIKSAFLGVINENWFLRVDISSLEVHDENKILHNPDSNNLLICSGITSNTPVDGVGLSLKKGTNDLDNEIEVPQKHVDLKNNTSKHAANRKRKNEHGLGNESLLKEKEAFMLHLSSQHSVGDRDNNENAALDSLTMKTMDDDQLLGDGSSSLNRKRKKIRKSSKVLDQAVSVVPSSGEDVLEEDSLGSKAISHKDFGEPNIVFVPGQDEQETTPSQLCGISLKEKHCHVLFSSSPNSYELMKEQENAIRKMQNRGNKHTQGNAENKEEKVRKRSKKKHKSTEKNLADLISEDQNVFHQSSTSTDKEREVEASSNLNGTKLELQKFKDETGPVPHQRNLESAECTKVQSHTLDHSNQGKAIEIHVSGSPPNSSCQMSNTRAKAEKKEEQVRKKSKKKRKLTEKNLADLTAEGQNVFQQSSKTSADNEKELEASSNRTKKSKLEEIDFKCNLNGTKLGLEKFEDETGQVPQQPNLESAKCTNVQSHILDHSDQGMPVEVNVTGNLPNSSCADEANNCLEISSKGDRINVEKHLPCHEAVGSGVVIVDKEAGADSGDKPKAKKGNKKADLHSTGTSLDLQSSLKSNDKQGIRKSQSEDKSDESVLHSEKKLPKTSRGEVKAPGLDMSDKSNSISEKTKRQNVANVYKTNNDSDKQNSNSFAVSNSVLERSKNTVGQNKMVNKLQLGVGHSQVANGKVSGKDRGEVVNANGFEKKKRLLGKSGSIFNDDSSGSSEEENGDDGSDTSTRTPSDHSLSSDYSDGKAMQI